MKKLLPFTLAVTLALSSNIMAAGQADHPLRTHIVDSLKVLEPRWSLDRTDHVPYSEDLKFETLFFVWKAGEARVGALVFIHLLPADAAETYRRVHGQGGLEGREANEAGLPGVGDESRLWKAEGSDYCQLYFRRGAVAVWIEASSIEAAKEFATRIAGELPAA